MCEYKDRVIKFRESIGLNQKEFAESLGYKQNTYNGYETGSRTIKADLLIKIAKAYKISADYLLGLSDIKEISGVTNQTFVPLRIRHITEKLPKLTEDQLESIEKRVDTYIDDNEIAAREVMAQQAKKAT